MQQQQTHPYQNAAGWSLLVLAVPLLLWLSLPARRMVIAPANLVFSHTAVELFTVVVAVLVFVTGYRAILSVRKGAVVLLGVTFLGVGVLGFLHTLSSVGRPDAIAVNTIFSLAERALAATALLVYVVLPAVPEITKLKKRLAVALMLAVVGVFGLVVLAWPDQVAALWVRGESLTSPKLGLEWLIVCVNLATLWVLWQRREELVRECVMALAFAATLSAVSELFFTTLGMDDLDGANVPGHLYRAVAYLYLFHATFNEALRRPLERIEAQHRREKLVLNAAPDGVLWVNDGGYILMVNPAMETLTGYAMTELVGQNVDIFLPPNLRVA
ncbi:MAG: MASE3 domain-containing protein, partial [Rhodoferax sp.]|nr:MASE3 domain-containing protein [Rhodoferax sp.]